MEKTIISYKVSSNSEELSRLSDNLTKAIKELSEFKLTMEYECTAEEAKTVESELLTALNDVDRVTGI